MVRIIMSVVEVCQFLNAPCFIVIIEGEETTK